MLFALCIEDIETPCFAAMPPSVSPDLTVYFVVPLEDELEDEALLVEAAYAVELPDM